MERTLLSAAFDFGLNLPSVESTSNPKAEIKTKSNFKSGGQECPPHTVVVILTRMLKQTLGAGPGADRRRVGASAAAGHSAARSIHQAMRHSVFAGGKRLRPILCIEAGRMVAGSLPAGIEDLGRSA